MTPLHRCVGMQRKKICCDIVATTSDVVGPHSPWNLRHRLAALQMAAFGTQRTCLSRRSMSAFGGEADIDQPAPAYRFYEYTRPSQYLRAGLIVAIARVGPGSCVETVTVAFFRSGKPDSPKNLARIASLSCSVSSAAPAKFRRNRCGRKPPWL